jgi:hypothetical protein
MLAKNLLSNMNCYKAELKALSQERQLDFGEHGISQKPIETLKGHELISSKKVRHSRLRSTSNIAVVKGLFQSQKNDASVKKVVV